MYKKMLVPIDGSPTSDRGFDEAVALARETGASVLLLHIVDPYPMFSGMELVPAITWQQLEKSMREQGQALLDAAHQAALAQGVAAESRLVEAGGVRVADVIVAAAREGRCDMIVMGTHGRRGISHLAMGSDAERVARQTPVPLLLVRGAQDGNVSDD